MPALLFVSAPVLAQTTFTVNSEGDAVDQTIGDGICHTGATIPSGPDECTFRAAIQEANFDALKDTIDFNFPGLGTPRLNPQTAYPAVSQPVIIDGTHRGKPAEIYGNQAPSNAIGLLITAGNSTVRGLAIFGFSDNGLVLYSGGNNIVQGMYLGVVASGQQAIGNALQGLLIWDSANNTIGGSEPGQSNRIAGNGGPGIAVVNAGSTGNVIVGNMIGRYGSSPAQFSNGLDGILLTSLEGETEFPSNNIIGGTQEGEGNIIAGNTRAGVMIFKSNGNQVLGNWIGTTKGVSVPSPNGAQGIQIDGGANNQIGGDSESAGNVISGNTLDGILVAGETATGNVIQGNRIGVSADGETVMPNGGSGVHLATVDGGLPSSNTTVGGAAPGLGNVISGNVGDGVRIEEGSSGNQVIGNIIGLGPLGIVPMANQQRGVAVIDSDTNIIGGDAESAGNYITANGEEGVLVTMGPLAHAPAGTQILGNIIGLSFLDESLGNAKDGVFLDDAEETIVGSELSGNTISGNFGNGLRIRGRSVIGGHPVRGNRLGVDSDAAEARPNRQNGILIQEGGDASIGHFEEKEGNIISGNAGHGILLDGPDDRVTSIALFVWNNRIGTNSDGASLGNGGNGIRVSRFNGTFIGGADVGNEIAFNGSALGPRGHGVVIDGGHNHLVSQNSIHSNAGRGIDLVDPSFPRGSPYAFNIPDWGDGDEGANTLINTPLVSDVSFAEGKKTVEWTIYGPPGTTYDLEIYTNEEADPSGFGEAQKWIKTVKSIETDPAGRVVHSETFPLESFDGEIIGPEALVSVLAIQGLNTSEISMIDSDGDAIADKWEELGIDVNEDGIRDYPIDEDDLPISDPLHKDVFVEIDAMECTFRVPQIAEVCFVPDETELLRVEQAFESVPGDLVGNPDNQDGITLHLELDETEIPHHDWVGEGENDQNGWEFFFKVKRNGSSLVPGGFGTPVERLLPGTLAAKRLFYRYAIFADHAGEWDKDAGRQFPSGTSGIAEATTGFNGTINDAFVDGGNDFMVTLGLWTVPGGTPDEKAGTLMHELGHTLGNMHGGVDHIHHKPNYYSVMNYLWQTPKDYPNWVLDYSRKELETLLEDDLDEPLGMGGDPSLTVPVGPPTFELDGSLRKHGKLVRQGGPVDFDRDGNVDSSDPPLEQGDLNNFGYIDFHDYNDDGEITDEDQQPEQTLIGHEDWSGLRFNFLGTPSAAQGQAPPIPPAPELDLEHSQHLDAIGETEGQLGFTVDHLLVDESAGIATLTVRRSGGTLGIVSVDYQTLDDSALAGDDYSETFGILDFAEGQVFASFDVPILDDGDPENMEVFEVRLSNPQAGATLGLDTLYVGIEPNDGAGILQFDNPFFEVDEDAGTATITVVRTGGTTGAVSVDYTTMDDVALEGFDYQAASGTLSFPDGDASKTFTVPLLADIEIEGNEGLVLNLANPTGGAQVGGIDQAVLTILEVPMDSAILEFAQSGYEVDEDGAGFVTVDVIRSGAVDVEVTVDLVTTDETAIAGDDYTTTTTTLTFLATETNQTVDIPILDDSSAEGVEHFQVSLFNPSEFASLGDLETTRVRISDDEAIVVTNVNEFGNGSLRWAIGQANASDNFSVINFNIPGDRVHTIRPVLPLQDIFEPVLIDGYSQPGASANSLDEGTNAVLYIELNGDAQGTPEGERPALYIAGSGVTIRGLVLNGFRGDGIQVQETSDAVIEGNFIGTDPSGTRAIPNDRGIDVYKSDFTRIGGNTREARNLIAGNYWNIEIDGVFEASPLTGTVIQGNIIGIGADGDALPSTNTAIIAFNSSGTVVGGPEPLEGNTIANSPVGVRFGITFNGIPNNTVRGNSIFNTGGCPILLTLDNDPDSVFDGALGGCTMINDPGDTDVGANHVQNYPVVQDVQSAEGETTLSGYLSSEPSRQHTLDFYANDSIPVDGYGEAQHYLGHGTVTTDATGIGQYSITLPVDLPDGTFITATATDPEGNTSGVSLRQAVGAVLVDTQVVNTIDDSDDGFCDSSHCSLREAIRDANNFQGPNTIEFDIPGPGPHTIQPLAEMAPISDSVLIDGFSQPGASPNTLATGSDAVPMVELDGVNVSGTSRGLNIVLSDTTIRGLVINRFARNIQPRGAGHRLEGNFLGTDITGTQRVCCGTSVYIWTETEEFTIGGLLPEQRNVISSIRMEGSRHRIQGNLIGIDRTGTVPLEFENPEPFAIRINGADNIIGGSEAGAGNVISGIKTAILTENRINGLTIQGNLIGTNATGDAVVGNSSSAIRLDGSNQPGILIGGSNPGEGNVMAGYYNGIWMNGSAATVQGNFIGTNPAGTLSTVNANQGIDVRRTPALIGGEDPGAGNVIVNNAKDGLSVTVPGVTISRNHISNNSELGIDLTWSGQPLPPVVDAGLVSGGMINLTGTLNDEPNSTYTLEFFDSEYGVSGGRGVGEVFIGAGDVTTDGTGEASYNFDFTYDKLSGRVVTATSTAQDGSTSEFSDLIFPVLEGLSDLTITASLDVDPVRENEESSFTATITNNGPDSATDVTLEVELNGFVFLRAVPDVPCRAGEVRVLCDLGDLASTASLEIQLVLDPVSTGLFEFPVTVRGCEEDPDTENNSVSLLAQILPPATADLYTSITDTPDPVETGGSLVYSVEVGNLGDFDTSDVTLQVQITDHALVTDIQPGDGCSESGGQVDCAIDFLASGQSTQIDITVEAGQPGVLMTAAAEVATTSTIDPDSLNNTFAESSFVTDACVSTVLASAHKGWDGMSSLYSIDPVTGDTTLIGDIGYERVGAMAFDPRTGFLYGAGERADGSDIQVLIEINPLTGQGREIGELGFTPVTDFAFREATGELYAFGGDSELYLVSIDTGTATLIDQITEIFYAGNALVFSPDGRLYLSNLALRELDPESGEVLAESPMTYTPNLPSERFSGLDFDTGSGRYYGIIKEGLPPPNAWFGYLDIPASEGTFLHPTVDGMDGIAISCNPAPNIMFKDGFEGAAQPTEIE